MDFHEYQAKQILKDFGIPIPEFVVISTPEELERALAEKRWSKVALKAQIYSGGRGKAGAVKIASHSQEASDIAKRLLHTRIRTSQSGPKGLLCHQLLVSPHVEIDREYYLALTIDRQKAQRILIMSPAGGIDIEQTAQENRAHLLILPLPLEGTLRPYHFIRIAKFMGWRGNIEAEGTLLIRRLIQAFIALDANLLEINPLAQLKEGSLTALDVKLTIDDNALYRQDSFSSLFDDTQVSPGESRAHALQLSYVSLEGTIGCMVNGAGLAMSTMDLIETYGGKSANFLDVGGGSSAEKVAEGFKIILSDPQVRVILVNIFGGIMDGETIASAIVEAIQATSLSLPLVVRLEGTHSEEGRALLKRSGLNIISANSLKEAVECAVHLADNS